MLSCLDAFAFRDCCGSIAVLLMFVEDSVLLLFSDTVPNTPLSLMQKEEVVHQIAKVVGIAPRFGAVDSVFIDVKDKDG